MHSESFGQLFCSLEVLVFDDSYEHEVWNNSEVSLGYANESL